MSSDAAAALLGLKDLLWKVGLAATVWIIHGI